VPEGDQNPGVDLNLSHSAGKELVFTPSHNYIRAQVAPMRYASKVR